MLENYVIEIVKLLIFFGVSFNFVHPRQAKAAKLSVGIAVLCAVMLPLVGVIADNGLKIPEIVFTEYKEIENENYVKIAFEEALQESVSTICDIDKNDVKVFVEKVDMESMKAEKIHIVLSGKGLYSDYRSLAEKIEKEFTNGGKCEVEFDI